MATQTNINSKTNTVKPNSVIDEINRGKEYSKLREQRQAGLETKVKPAYELDKPLYPDVYVKKCIVPDYTPNYEECQHVKRKVINRDALDINEHINLLSQPKFVQEKKIEQPYIVKKKVGGPTHRLMELARPNKRQALETCKRYAATMEQFCIENCHRNIEDVTFVPVHDAVYFIKLKKRKPLIEKQRLKLRMKRLQQKISEAKMASMHEILQQLYSSLKPFLLIPIEANDAANDLVVRLSTVIKQKLCTMLDRTSESKENVLLDKLLVQMSEKLAVWMKALLNFNQIQPELTIETEEVLTAAATVTQGGGGTVPPSPTVTLPPPAVQPLPPAVQPLPPAVQPLPPAVQPLPPAVQPLPPAVQPPPP